MGLPCHTRSDMCERLPGFLPITAEIDLNRLQLLNRLCDLDTTSLTKRIFITRLFSYLLKNDIRHYGFVQDIIPILVKYNLYPTLKVAFPPKEQQKRSVILIVLLGLQELLHDFYQLNIMCAGKSPSILMGHSKEKSRDCPL